VDNSLFVGFWFSVVHYIEFLHVLAVSWWRHCQFCHNTLSIDSKCLSLYSSCDHLGVDRRAFCVLHAACVFRETIWRVCCFTFLVLLSWLNFILFIVSTGVDRSLNLSQIVSLRYWKYMLEIAMCKKLSC
jgi:hypothetical protein